jgi:hypothetical protein
MKLNKSQKYQVKYFITSDIDSESIGPLYEEFNAASIEEAVALAQKKIPDISPYWDERIHPGLRIIKVVEVEDDRYVRLEDIAYLFPVPRLSQLKKGSGEKERWIAILGMDDLTTERAVEIVSPPDNCIIREGDILYTYRFYDFPIFRIATAEQAGAIVADLNGIIRPCSGMVSFLEAFLNSAGQKQLLSLSKRFNPDPEKKSLKRLNIKELRGLPIPNLSDSQMKAYWTAWREHLKIVDSCEIGVQEAKDEAKDRIERSSNYLEKLLENMTND